MGESTYSTPDRTDEITIGMMARDAVALVEHVGWKDVDMLGFSMGGTLPTMVIMRPHAEVRLSKFRSDSARIVAVSH